MWHFAAALLIVVERVEGLRAAQQAALTLRTRLSTYHRDMKENDHNYNHHPHHSNSTATVRDHRFSDAQKSLQSLLLRMDRFITENEMKISEEEEEEAKKALLFASSFIPVSNLVTPSALTSQSSLSSSSSAAASTAASSTAPSTYDTTVDTSENPEQDEEESTNICMIC